MFVDFNILNQLGSPSINSNTFANRPAAGQTGRLFVSTDTFEIYRDNGTGWDLIGSGSAGISGSGTATQVAYFTGATAIGSSANLYWDNTNTRLGIGTNIPTDTLSVTGTAYITGDITGNRLIKIGGLSTQYLMADGSTSTLTNPITGTGTATQVAYFTGASAIGSSSNLYWDNTNTRLGIGTSTPGARLDIHGTGTLQSNNSTGATNNNYLALQRAGSNIWRLGDTYNGGDNYFSILNSNLSSDAFIVYANTSEKIAASQETYSTGDSIGILARHNLTIPAGTSIGLAALGAINSNLNVNIQGNATIGATGRQGLEGNSVISFTGLGGTLTVTQGATVRAFSALSSVYAFSGVATGTITHLAGLRVCFPDNSGVGVNITNNYAILINDQTTGTGTVTYTNRWGIYQEGASDLNYFNGNLLIKSTTNTGEALQVNGTAIISSNITANSFIPTGSGVPVNGLYLPAANSIGLATNTTERVRINDSGNIGIATATIGSTLQVNGNAAIGYSASTAAPTNGLAIAGQTIITNELLINGGSLGTANGLHQWYNTTTNQAWIQAFQSGVDWRPLNINAQIQNFLINDVSVLYINNSRNVGINTTTIGSKLQVNGNCAIGYSASTAAPTNGLAVSGNVGIGTNSPSGRLDLSSSGDNYFNILTSGAASAAVLNMFNSVSGGNGAAIGYNIALRFGTVTGVNAAGFTERMRITDTALVFSDAINITVNTATGTKIGTGTSQKLAFWNATPIVQPTTAVAGAARVGGGGATVTDTDTFGGYTIAQVVQALRNTGILA